MPPSAAKRGVEETLQAAGATTGNGTALGIPSSLRDHEFIVKGTGTITSGVISIEEAATPDYTGTWSLISAVNGTDVTAGATKVVHVSSIFSAIRARISTNIGGGGSVNVTYKGN